MVGVALVSPGAQEARIRSLKANVDLRIEMPYTSTDNANQDRHMFGDHGEDSGESESVRINTRACLTDDNNNIENTPYHKGLDAKSATPLLQGSV